MAMDALKKLVNNVPDWLQRLDDLSGQIDRHQTELAAVAAAEGKSPVMVHCHSYVQGFSNALMRFISWSRNLMRKVKMAARVNQIKRLAEQDVSEDGNNDDKLPLLRCDQPPTAYRTRSMVIVYYDSYVQGFFDELVRFVSSSRNLMRKAKMAARVAQIKKLAEQDVSEDGNNDDALPSLRYMSSRRFGPMSISRPGAGDQPPDVYDNLDKGLEFVQSMCEHGAHQFLRDGDCNDEISKVQKTLGEVLEMAKTEMERVEREEPELAKETGEVGKVRTRRPISMRRGMPVDLKEGSPIPTKELEPAKPTAPADPMALIEVDPDIIEADEGIDVEMELLTL
jgi:hypothetical protein